MRRYRPNGAVPVEALFLAPLGGQSHELVARTADGELYTLRPVSYALGSEDDLDLLAHRYEGPREPE